MKAQNKEDFYKDLERFNRLVDEVKDEILSLLKNPESMSKYMMESQLRSIFGEINTMKTTLGQYNVYPDYPKGIADCWDLDDPLAVKLDEILHLYDKLKRVYNEYI